MASIRQGMARLGRRGRVRSGEPGRVTLKARQRQEWLGRVEA